jgi:hypothetical protein
MHGHLFQAKLIAISDSMKNDSFGGGACGSLTLYGWCQSVTDYGVEIPFEREIHLKSYHFLNDTRYSSVPGALARANFYPDTPLDPASVHAVLNRRDVILLQVSDFKPHFAVYFQTYALMLEPVDGSANMYRRIGLMMRSVELHESPEVVIVGWDLRSVILI